MKIEKIQNGFLLKAEEGYVLTEKEVEFENFRTFSIEVFVTNEEDAEDYEERKAEDAPGSEDVPMKEGEL